MDKEDNIDKNINENYFGCVYSNSFKAYFDFPHQSQAKSKWFCLWTLIVMIERFIWRRKNIYFGDGIDKNVNDKDLLWRERFLEILWNDIGKENNVIDKNVNDIWFLKEKKDLLWRERFLEMILSKKTVSLTKT